MEGVASVSDENWEVAIFSLMSSSGEGYKASSRKRYKVMLNFLAKEFIGKGSYTGVYVAGA